MDFLELALFWLVLNFGFGIGALWAARFGETMAPYRALWAVE